MVLIPPERWSMSTRLTTLYQACRELKRELIKTIRKVLLDGRCSCLAGERHVQLLEILEDFEFSVLAPTVDSARYIASC